MVSHHTDESWSAVSGPSPSLPFWGGMALLSLSLCIFLGARWEERLAHPGAGAKAGSRGPSPARMTISRSGALPRPRACAKTGGQAFRRIEEKGGVLSADYGFFNFNNDPLRVAFSVSAREFASYRLGYGYTDAELDALKKGQKRALDDAYQYAVKNRLKQEQLNRTCEEIAADHRAKLVEFLKARGFTTLPGNVIVADIPGVARRNVKNLKPIALALNGAGEKRGYHSDEIIGAALSLVQTAIAYENVPGQIAGRRTGGIYPPVETIARGKGDCDTKTALLGAILLNWDRMKLVGVAGPKHYLMGILRNPAKGEMFVEHNGLRYVLVEPAGPGWLPPGTIAATTAEFLQSGNGVRIEPL